jgi:hypothetical protein
MDAEGDDPEASSSGSDAENGSSSSDSEHNRRSKKVTGFAIHIR